MEKKVYIDLPPFTGRNVPIKEIAQASEKTRTISALPFSRGFLNSEWR